MVSTGEASVFRPFQNLRCCHESPRPSGRYRKFWKGLKAKWKVSKILEGSQKQVEEGIENSERVSKQILILHEELGFENWYGTKLEDPVDLASYSISSGAQYVTLDNKIKCLSVAISFLATPPIKL
jgi:hypothetical protein